MHPLTLQCLTSGSCSFSLRSLFVVDLASLFVVDLTSLFVVDLTSLCGLTRFEDDGLDLEFLVICLCGGATNCGTCGAETGFTGDPEMTTSSSVSVSEFISVPDSTPISSS